MGPTDRLCTRPARRICSTRRAAASGSHLMSPATTTPRSPRVLALGGAGASAGASCSHTDQRDCNLYSSREERERERVGGGDDEQQVGGRGGVIRTRVTRSMRALSSPAAASSCKRSLPPACTYNRHHRHQHHRHPPCGCTISPIHVWRGRGRAPVGGPRGWASPPPVSLLAVRLGRGRGGECTALKNIWGTVRWLVRSTISRRRSG